MNPVNKKHVPIITKPEELHAKGFISDAQLDAALANDREKLGKADDEVLALYTLKIHSDQNPMTSDQTNAIKNAKGLSSQQKPSDDEKQSDGRKKANAELIKDLKDDDYYVVNGLPGKDECMIVSALKSFADEKQPDLQMLYKTHQQCANKLKANSTSNMDGSEDIGTDSTEESDVIVADSDDDADNIPLNSRPKKTKTVSHAAQIEELLAKLPESKVFNSSNIYVTLYKPNLDGKHVSYTIGKPGESKIQIILIHYGDRIDAAIRLSTSKQA
ncbi:MAG TPA: hypothetical protein VF797_02640 [Noviherbaspirillum sp.]